MDLIQRMSTKMQRDWTRARKVTHPHVLPPFPPGWVARHRLVQNARSRSNSQTASLHPECKRPLPSTHDRSYTCRVNL